MGSIVITWRELMIGAVIVLAIYIAEMLFFMRSGRRPPAQSNGPSSGGGSKQETLSMATLKGLIERVNALEKQLAAMQQASSDLETTPYQKAIQMARQGRDAGRISEACSIPRGEAELIVAMHGGHE